MITNTASGNGNTAVCDVLSRPHLSIMIGDRS